MLLKITGTNEETKPYSKSSKNEDSIVLSREEWLKDFAKETIFLFKKINKETKSAIIKNNFNKPEKFHNKKNSF